MKLSVITLLFTAVSLANGDADVEQGHRMLALDASTCTEGVDCCTGTSACLNAGNAGTASVTTNSCDGEKACQNAGRYSAGSASVGEGSCDGDFSCQNGGRSGNLEVAAGSCTGVRGCSQGGRETGSSLIVGAGSCIGEGTRQRACDTAGMLGSVQIGDGSCNGDRTCSQLGRDGTASVGNGSCLGYQSCFLAARNDGEVHIGNNSCTRNRSCRAIGKNAVEGLEDGSIQIGNNSCNCVGCCGCLKAGDIVGNDMCNSLGDGTNECCISVGDRNPFGPIGDNNLCWDQNDKCRKATVSGDPHIRTFSGVRYDCMGQGEFILSQSQNVADPLDIRGLFVDPQFTGEEDPWASDQSPQTVTRGVSFKVDPDVPRVKIMTDDINVADQACSLYFYIEQPDGSMLQVTRHDMLTDTSLLQRPDVHISSRGEYDMRFKFGEYEADLTVRVSSTSRRWGCVISFSSCLKDEYHGDVLGLFGTNNPYKNDDWTTPAGDQLVIPTNPRSSVGRGASTDFCNTHWCYRGTEANSFFGPDYTYYSRCDHSPYESHYDPVAFEAMLETITQACDEEELDYNIPSEALYDAALANHIQNETYNQCPIPEIEAQLIENEIATFNCERTPEDGGTGGDPHFNTWKNEHYEFHGQCDLTLVKDQEFADALGLDIQIRTKIVRFWSYIKNVAIRIGNDILEIEGSADAEDAEAHYWINYEYQGDLDEFAGFPVTQKLPSVYKRKYIIDLSSKYPGAAIVVQLYKEFVRVRFTGDESVFGNTVGLLGDYKTGKTLARDGVTEIHDFEELGDEWQVLPSEPKLFREAEHPQFPEQCIKPEDPRGERTRRLSESNVTVEEAEAACASLLDELAIKDCVYDILATQDLGMVGAF